MRRAAMANMRPNWPLPSTPMAAPGRIGVDHANSSERTLRGLFLAKHAQLLAQRRIVIRQDRHREQRRVLRAGFPDRQSADRNSARHLNDGQQRIQAFQRLAFHRHAQHRQQRVGRHHSWKMRRAARSGDDHLQAARLGAGCILHHPGGRAMRGDHLRLMRHAEARQCFAGRAHRLPVGLAAHDDADQWLHSGYCPCESV